MSPHCASRPSRRIVCRIICRIVLPAWLLCSIVAGQEPTVESPRVLQGHADTVYDVAFSSASDRIATASFDGLIKVWRVEDGALETTFSGHTGKVLALAFSADGGSLLSGGEDKVLRLWSLPQSGPRAIAGPGGAVRALASSADGRWLACGTDQGAVALLERASGRILFTTETPGGVAALAFSPDLALLAAAGADGSVRLLALPAPPPPPPAAAAGAPIVALGASWRYHKGAGAPAGGWRAVEFDDSGWESGASGFGYSSNADELATVKTRLDDMPGKYVSLFARAAFEVGAEARVAALGLEITYDDGFVAYLNGEEVHRVNVEGSPPGHDASAMAAGEPTKIAVDLAAHIGKLRPGRNVLAIQGHNAGAASSDFVLSPVLLGVIERPAPPPAGSEPGRIVRAIDGFEGGAACVAFSPDGKTLAAAGARGLVRRHAIASGAAIGSFDAIDGAVHGVAFLDDETLASAHADGKARVWKLGDGAAALAATIEADAGGLTSVAAHTATKTLVTGGAGGAVKVWRDDFSKAALEIAAHGGAVRHLSVSADGKHVLSGADDGAARVTALADGSQVTRLEPGAALTGVAIASDGRYYTAGKGGDVLEWRLATSGESRSLSGHGALVHAVALSADGAIAVSGSADKTVRIWTLGDGQQKHSIAAHEGSVYSVAISPDSSLVASAGYDNLVKLWNAESGAETRKLAGHEQGVFALAFTADGKRVVSGSSDHTIRVWSVESGEALHVLDGHPGWVMDLALAGGGRAASADYGGHLLLWDLDAGKPLGRHRVQATVHGFAVSPDGAWCATANASGAVFLFRSPKELR